MLLGIALDGEGRADPGRAPPEHVVVPRAGEFFFQRQSALPLAQIGDHGVDRCEGRLARFGRLRVEQQPAVPLWSGLDQLRAGLRWERVLPSLVHQAGKVEIEGDGDPPAFDPQKFAVRQHRDPTRGSDTEKRLIEQPHEVAHGHHPRRAIIGVGQTVPACKEDIHAPLQAGQ